MNKQLNKKAVVAQLNKILEIELANVVRYTHYALMIFGYNRIPIVAWLRTQATESLLHANEAGEMITSLGEHPSLSIGPLPETHQHDVGDILHESLELEVEGLQHYRKLLDLVRDRSVVMEEYARRMIFAEETHVTEVDKMLRTPGDVAPYRSRKR